VRSLVVVVGDEGVELGLQRPDGRRRGAGGEPVLQGLVEPFDLAAGLGVIGPGVPELHAELEEFCFERDPTGAAVGAGEHGAVVRQHPGRNTPNGGRFAEAGHDVGGFEHRPGVGADRDPGVVIDNVQDLDAGPLGETPVGDVELPTLVRLVGFETHVGAARPLVRLGNDESSTSQYPPDR
jgi:hypothetical protein